MKSNVSNVSNGNNKIEEVKESYNRLAREFNVTRVFTWNWTDNFIEKLEKNALVLDIGCGNGRNMIYKSVKIFGLDISINQLSQKKIKDNLVCANMINLPYKNNVFDHIICIATFHHLPTEESRLRALEEIKRVLKWEGRVLLSVWSIHQPRKTKRIFNDYGDNLVPWKGKKETIMRYYYIFKLKEINNLLNKIFTIEKYIWDSGNEIFYLINNKK
jgi:tRNA (uracil-5-)-methyltransferase TRM9